MNIYIIFILLIFPCYADQVVVNTDSYSTNFNFEGSSVKYISDDQEISSLLKNFYSSETDSQLLDLFTNETRAELAAVLEDPDKGKLYRAALKGIETMRPVIGIFKKDTDLTIIVEIIQQGGRRFFQPSEIKKIEGKWLLVYKKNDFNSAECVLSDMLTRNPNSKSSLKINVAK
jgi:hypothetical protein